MKTVMKNVWILWLLVSTLWSCGDGKKGQWLPSVSGASGEVILVIEDNLWEDSLGSVFKQVLAHDYPALPQPEPSFSIVQIPGAAFKKLFLQQRNIIRVKVSEDSIHSQITIQENMWAKPQVVVTISAPSVQDMIDLLWREGTKLHLFLEQAERKRTQDAYFTYKDNDVMKQIKNDLNVDITLPKGFTMDVLEKDFAWLSRMTGEVEQGLFIYHYVYQDTGMFNVNMLIDKRNRMLKKYVPIASSVEAWMTTETDYYTVNKRGFLLNDMFTAELRGLWRAEPRFVGMGGPFISFTTVDTLRNRVVTVEGFVYAPDTRKRNYLRQMEAILYTSKPSEVEE